MVYVILLIVTSMGYPDYSPVHVWHSSIEVAHVAGVYSRSNVMGCVYLAWNEEGGKGYVGKTVGTMEDRRKGHERAGKNGSGFLLHRAFRKYGFDVFEWRVLMESDDEDDLNDLEISCIKMLKTKVPNGYNLTDGGEGCAGYFPSDEVRAKMSRAKIGKKLLPEVVAKIAESNRGRICSLETRDKIRASKIGKPGHKVKPTLETRAKISASRMGQKHSPEIVAKIAESNRGRRHTPEVRDKISKANSGKPKSPEHRAKLSRAKKGKKMGPLSVECRAKISRTKTGKKRKPFSEEWIENMRKAHRNQLRGADGKFVSDD